MAPPILTSPIAELPGRLIVGLVAGRLPLAAGRALPPGAWPDDWPPGRCRHGLDRRRRRDGPDLRFPGQVDLDRRRLRDGRDRRSPWPVDGLDRRSPLDSDSPWSARTANAVRTPRTADAPWTADAWDSDAPGPPIPPWPA